jgi:hypothetical protein
MITTTWTMSGTLLTDPVQMCSQLPTVSFPCVVVMCDVHNNDKSTDKWKFTVALELYIFFMVDFLFVCRFDLH